MSHMKVCVWLREVLWPRSSHLTSRHLSLPQLNQHPPPPIPPLSLAVPAVGWQCVRSLASAHRTESDWVFVWVLGGGHRWWLHPTPHLHSAEFRLFLSTLLIPTGNHALSKQTAGVRAKAISTIGLLLMDSCVCWQVVYLSFKIGVESVEILFMNSSIVCFIHNFLFLCRCRW